MHGPWQLLGWRAGGSKEKTQQQLLMCEKALNEFMDGKRQAWVVERCQMTDGYRFVDTTSDWNIMEHMLKGIARSPCCICPKTGIRFLPSCAAAAGVPTFLLHVISRLAGRLEQWQQSCKGGPSLSKVLQCNCPLPAK